MPLNHRYATIYSHKVQRTRRKRLRALADEHGRIGIARAAGYTAGSYISQMLSNRDGRSARRPISDATARHIEASMNLEPGWLDRDR